MDVYFERTKDFWTAKATEIAAKEGIEATPKQIKKAAVNIAKEFWQKKFINK
jgi:hypothetical protein